MFSRFNEDAKKIISLAKEQMFELKHPYLGSEHLLLGILKNNNNVSAALKKCNVTYKIYRQAVIDLIGIGDKKSEWVLYTPVVREIFDRAVEISLENNNDVTIEDLFVSLIEIGDGIANRVLNNLKVNIDKIYSDFVFQIPKKSKKKKSLLQEIGIELTDKNINFKFDPVIGREKEIKQIIEILVRKNKSNPILLGDAGVGKTAIVEQISKMICNNNVPNKLKNKKIINLDMAAVVAGTKYRGEFEEKINKIIREAENDPDIILFIDEIHTIVGAGGAEGAIDASNIFKPALARGNIKCIGATTMDEYKKYIEKDKALERRFKKVIIQEPTLEEVTNIMEKLKPVYEQFHHVIIKKNIMSMLITLTNKYIHEYKNPDKTIDILDEVCAHANLKENPKMKEYDKLAEKLSNIINHKKEMILDNNFKEAYRYKREENAIVTKLNDLELMLTTSSLNIVTKKDLYEVLSSKVNVPIYELNKSFNEKSIIKKLKSKIIGQDIAIEKLVTGYFNNIDTNEVFSVLLSGSSGIGKTSLAVNFANLLSDHVLRLDMSEYSEAHTVSKLIGAPPGYVGYESHDYLFDSIREFPFTVIILDEIERCHENVLNLFFQIMDNSVIKDAKGNIIHFNNCIIIMTTNIKGEKTIGFEQCKINSQLNDYFTIPFINRLNEIITMSSLSRLDIIKIIKKQLAEINSNLTLNESLLQQILLDSNYSEYGARQIKNILGKIKKTKKEKKYAKTITKNKFMV